MQPSDERLQTIQNYWNERIHDLDMTTQPIGTREFFDDLDDYRFDKLRYLPNLVDFNGYRGRDLLEVGCGIGTDLLRFARGGAKVTGVDLAHRSIELAQANFRIHDDIPSASLLVENGEALPFDSETFDVVYTHGVLQYTADPLKMISECHRVLRSGGEAIFMVYNRYSWLYALSKLTGVGLEHADAPVLSLFSRSEFFRLVEKFPERNIIADRFPVASRLHRGWKALLYNGLFVRAFTVLPVSLVRPVGWHLMAFCRK